MAISKANPGGFSANDKLTSAQLSAIDTNTTYGADKRSGQTDTIESVWSMSGGGRIIPSVTTGSDSNSTVQPGASTNLIRYASGTLTANRSATLGTTGVVSGDIVAFEIEGGSYEVTIKDQASATMFVLGVLDTSEGEWFEAIYLGSAWRPYRRPRAKERSQTFTSNGTFVVPPGVTQLRLIGCGGGGGGGSGSAGYLGASAGDFRRALGSGGGGGALRGVQLVTVTPGSSQAVVIGAGGAGASVDGAAGSDGADTTFGSLATFRGAMGGLGSGTTVDDDSTRLTLGGGNMRGEYIVGASGSKLPSTTVIGYVSQPSFGGLGTCVAGGTGNYSPEGNASGTGGAQGADSTLRGGGGGGGGGGGAFGAGTNGGAGGYGSVAANAQDGFNASNASANTGAGGGGGGGGGEAQNGVGTVGGGGNGGDGGSGKLIVVWVK